MNLSAPTTDPPDSPGCGCLLAAAVGLVLWGLVFWLGWVCRGLVQ